MINRVILEGRLGSDPVKYETPSGKVYTFLSIPLFNPFQRDREETEWAQCQVWGKSAEYMIQNAKKGMTVSVEGRLRSPKRVNAKGEISYRTYVAVDTCHLHRNRGASRASSGENAAPPSSLHANSNQEGKQEREQPQNPSPNKTQNKSQNQNQKPPVFDPNFDPFA